jgi:hypothetical protein
MVCLHPRFKILGSTGSLVTAIKPKSKHKFHARPKSAAMLLFYILKSLNKSLLRLTHTKQMQFICRTTKPTIRIA